MNFNTTKHQCQLWNKGFQFCTKDHIFLSLNGVLLFS
jgi:hypothetical protein